MPYISKKPTAATLFGYIKKLADPALAELMKMMGVEKIPQPSPSPQPPAPIPPTPTPEPTHDPTPTPTPTPTPEPQPTPTSDKFSGQAVSIKGTLNGVAIYSNDSGILPGNGGYLTKTVASMDTPLTTGEQNANTQGAFNQSRSQSIVYGLRVAAGSNEFTSEVVAVSCQATCEGNTASTEGGLFGNLLVNGSSFAITGAPNQSAVFEDGTTIVINEQIKTGSSITVNGLHIRTADGATDLIISSATSGINC